MCNKLNHRRLQGGGSIHGYRISGCCPSMSICTLRIFNVPFILLSSLSVLYVKVMPAEKTPVICAIIVK